MNLVKLKPFTTWWLEADFKLNVCTLSFIPELGSHCPKPPTFSTLPYLSRTYSARHLLPTHFLPTDKTSLFLKVC